MCMSSLPGGGTTIPCFFSHTFCIRTASFATAAPFGSTGILVAFVTVQVTGLLKVLRQLCLKKSFGDLTITVCTKGPFNVAILNPVLSSRRMLLWYGLAGNRSIEGTRAGPCHTQLPDWHGFEPWTYPGVRPRQPQCSARLGYFTEISPSLPLGGLMPFPDRHGGCKYYIGWPVAFIQASKAHNLKLFDISLLCVLPHPGPGPAVCCMLNLGVFVLPPHHRRITIHYRRTSCASQGAGCEMRLVVHR